MSATVCETPRVLGHMGTRAAARDRAGRVTVTVRGTVTFASGLGQRALLEAAWKQAQDAAGPVAAGSCRREVSLEVSAADGTASYRVVDREE